MSARELHLSTADDEVVQPARRSPALVRAWRAPGSFAMASTVTEVLIRQKTSADAAACLELLLRVHARDGYPLYLPVDAGAFITPAYESAAWVAEVDDEVVGHVALHNASVDPTLAAAQRATGLPAEKLTVVSRLFTDPKLRRGGVGRELLRHATAHAKSLGQRAVLDVGKALTGPVALYESEGWTRAEELHLTLREGVVLDLWVYLSPAV